MSDNAFSSGWDAGVGAANGEVEWPTSSPYDLGSIEDMDWWNAFYSAYESEFSCGIPSPPNTTSS